jgi:flagellum-specific peptidoglycan hydrolase FlgJ
MTTLAERLHAYRKRHRISQGELAQRLGVTWITVQRWESGKNTPQAAQRRAIEALLEGDVSRIRTVDLPWDANDADAWEGKGLAGGAMKQKKRTRRARHPRVLTGREDALGFSVTEAVQRLVGGGKKAAAAAQRGYAYAAPRVQQAYAYAKPRAEAAYAAAKPRVQELHRRTPRKVKIGVAVAALATVSLVMWNRRDRNTFKTKGEFVQRLWSALNGLGLSTASKRLLVAQAALESGWGRGTASRKGFNYWNVTSGSTWKGSTVWAWDKECYIWGYVCRPKLQSFRKYKTDAEAMLDFMQFLETRRYESSLAALKKGNLAAYAEALRDDGFYTATLDHYTTGMRSALSTIDSALGPAVA